MPVPDCTDLLCADYRFVSNTPADRASARLERGARRFFSCQSSGSPRRDEARRDEANGFNRNGDLSVVSPQD